MYFSPSNCFLNSLPRNHFSSLLPHKLLLIIPEGAKHKWMTPLSRKLLVARSCKFTSSPQTFAYISRKAEVQMTALEAQTSINELLTVSSIFFTQIVFWTRFLKTISPAPSLSKFAHISGRDEAQTSRLEAQISTNEIQMNDTTF